MLSAFWDSRYPCTYTLTLPDLGNSGYVNIATVKLQFIYSSLMIFFDSAKRPARDAVYVAHAQSIMHLASEL